MENAVITKPYSISIDASADELPMNHDECFFTLIDRNGKWRINTLLKGFATTLSALASSYSNTGDIILIGKNKQDMLHAFNRMKEIGGGIVMVEDSQVVCELPLTLHGIMSNLPIEELISQEKRLLDRVKRARAMHFQILFTVLPSFRQHICLIFGLPRRECTM